MAVSNYLKYLIPYSLLYEKLNTEKQYKNIIFYLDVLSISRGFYNKAVIDKEIGNYMDTKQMPTLYIKELKEFLNTIYTKFKYYNPKFVLFFDGGMCIQNTTISKFYKANRASQKYFYLEESHKELYSKIKDYYLNEVNTNFNKSGLSCVLASQEYEMDLAPHYVIANNFLNSQSPNILNVILSIDKDLLQTCKFPNTVQAVSLYKKSQSKIDMHLYDNDDAVSYIHKGYKRGGLTAEYIPLILAMSGDKIDGIDGIKRVGPATAIKMIQRYNLPPIITKTTVLPSELQEHQQKLIDNVRLTSFDEQISRIPITEKNKFDKRLNEL